MEGRAAATGVIELYETFAIAAGIWSLRFRPSEFADHHRAYCGPDAEKSMSTTRL